MASGSRTCTKGMVNGPCGRTPTVAVGPISSSSSFTQPSTLLMGVSIASLIC